MQYEANANTTISRLIAIINKLLLVIAVLITGVIAMAFFFYRGNHTSEKNEAIAIGNSDTKKDVAAYWQPQDINNIADAQLKAQVAYGKELIIHTAKYLGPNGTVLQMSNGLNCQNCHLQAGTAVFGNNFGSVAAMYPRFSARSGAIENVYKRVNDCLERSLNGKALDTTSKEMQAIAAYINFIGANVEKGKKAPGAGLKELPYLDRAADTAKGNIVFISKCQSCHQPNGEGVLTADRTEYVYPALWGNASFNDAAGSYRIISLAKFVKCNMPLGATYNNPQLSDEEAWDVAAFVNTRSRPHINVPKDWPDNFKKPVDFPFAPYADNFSAQQHKLGPFKPIIDAQKKTDMVTTKR